jgi:hypothetical protein
VIRLAVLLVILVVIGIVRLIQWLAAPKTPPYVPPTYGPGAFGPPPNYGPPGYGPPNYPPNYGQPNYGQPNYGPPPGQPSFGPPPGGMWQAAPQPQPFGMQPAPQPLAPTTAPARFLARPNVTFAQISACIAQTGLQLAAQPAPSSVANEAAAAVWQNEATRVAYTFDANTYARVVEISGANAEAFRQQLEGQLG